MHLLFTDKQTRLVDMRSFLGHGPEADDLKSKGNFRKNLTLVTEALIWKEPEDEIGVTFSSEELLQASMPMDEEEAEEVWLFPEKIDFEI